MTTTEMVLSLGLAPRTFSFAERRAELLYLGSVKLTICGCDLRVRTVMSVLVNRKSKILNRTGLRRRTRTGQALLEGQSARAALH